MQNIDKIQGSLDYIEENIKAEITAEELAQEAGYSLFHYLRLFKALVGIPLMQYITRRKLLHAVYEIGAGNKIVETAFMYGFETKAGFYKAFMREFGCVPSEYVRQHVVKKPYRMNLIQEGHIIMTKNKIKEMLVYWNLEKEEVTDFYYAGTDRRADNVWNVGEVFLMKIGTNIKGLENHIQITKALAEKGFETPVPVKTAEGKEYFFDGELYFYLSKRLVGEPFKGSELYADNNVDNMKEMQRYVGEVVGQLDATLQEFDKEIVCNEPDLLSDVLKWAIPKMREVSMLPEAFFRDYEKTFTKLYPKLPKQLIHRDPNPGNIIMKDGKAGGILDFELSERNIRLFDACYAATAVLSETFETKKEERDRWFDIFRNILIGYDSVVVLSKEEKRAVPYVVFSIQLVCTAYFAGLDKYEELAETNMEMLKWLIQNREKLEVF